MAISRGVPEVCYSGPEPPRVAENENVLGLDIAMDDI